jgi:hypothetical protein
MVHWKGPKSILPHAADIVNSYDTGVSLRQLFYRLVSDETHLPNTENYYGTLSHESALLRAVGQFPDLTDDTREIYNTDHFGSVDDILNAVIDSYRLDHTLGQDRAIYIGVEKDALRPQLVSWFGDCGFPIVVLRGNASQSYVKEVKGHVEDDERPAVLFYAGDFDPSGEQIEEDFVRRVGVFDESIRVAVLEEQVRGPDSYNLVINKSKPENKNNDAFIRRHQEFLDEYFDGRAAQVETDAIEPSELRNLFREAIAPYWDKEVYKAVIEKERRDKKELETLIGSII